MQNALLKLVKLQYNIVNTHISRLEIVGRNTNFTEGDMKWKKKLLLCCLPVARAQDYMR